MSEDSRPKPKELLLGDSTADPKVVEYRLGKVASLAGISGRWLDCGCAEGFYAAALRRRGASEVVGCDVVGERIEAAREKWASVDGLSFIVAAAEAVPFHDSNFDGILLNEVLEHVQDEQRSLAEMHRVLKPGGYIAVFSPNRFFPFEGHGAVFGRIRLRFPVPLLPWLPRRLAYRFMTARNYWPWELASLVSTAGFKVEGIDFALPLFWRYRWMPHWVVDRYLKALPRLEDSPMLRRFGVSTVVLARKVGPS